MKRYPPQLLALSAALVCLPLFQACHKTADTGASASAATCYDITLNKTDSPTSIIQIKQTEAEYTVNLYTDQPACISLSGSFDGGVIINNQKNVDINIKLKDVRITSNERAGYLKLKSNDKNIGNTYTIELIGKSEIIGAADKDSKSVISSKPNLVFKGDGSLSLLARYKNGIVSDDVIAIESGNIDIKLDRKEAAQLDKYDEKGFGIQADNGFEMSGGRLTIDAADGITNYESRGIKVDGSDKTSYNTGKGYIKISGGELTIRSDAKGLSAGWELAEDAKTETTEDDPHPDILISGGIIDITTNAEPRSSKKMGPPPERQMDENGSHAGGFPMPPDWADGERPPRPPHMADGERPPRPPKDETGPDTGFRRRPSPNKRREKPAQAQVTNADGSSMNTVSPEGIEAKRNLIISGGKITVRATDDGLNAGDRLEISGGELVVWSTTNDALDANGHAYISGGITALFGASDPDGALDADRDENVSYTGGTLFALGGANNAPQGEGTTGTFVAATLVEAKGGFPGTMRDKTADGADREPPQDDGQFPGAHGPQMGERKRESSELADAMLVLADAENQSIAALKVPAEFAGGGSVLVLSDKLQKGKAYRIYTNPTPEQPISSWHLDILSTDAVRVSGDKFIESNAGSALPGRFGPMMHGRGGHTGRSDEGAQNVNTKPQDAEK